MSYSTQFLGQKVRVKIDRAMGSKHPKFDMIYPINYGFIEGIMAPDGEELDAYILGVDKPVEQFTGQCIAVIHRTDDEDDKLIVVPEGEDYTDEEIRELTDFQEKYFKSEIIR
ncbi:inorganic pyrophosphatase [Candidatus Parcubacteria bacterium]|jgi:inorganic pyrophosphatase|nr:inorganic pyrophosphatase [Candidatus Parcubacteria bacterium]